MDKAPNNSVRRTINNNAHELFVLSLDEMNRVVHAQAKPSQRTNWQKLKDKVEVGANYTATGKDITTLTKLFADLGFAGVKAHIKYYQGKPYVIFKGHPGLRKIFTGTRYGLQNAKVVQMGIGKNGALNAAKSGGVITIVLVSAFRVADYILTDQMTLNQLIGTLVTDVVKIGIATGASIAAATAAAAVFTVAVGPIVAAIGVGLLVSYGLSKLDDHLELTNKVIAALDELEREAISAVDRVEKGAARAVGQAVDQAIDHVLDSARRIIIDTAKHYLYRNIPKW